MGYYRDYNESNRLTELQNTIDRLNTENMKLNGKVNSITQCRDMLNNSNIELLEEKKRLKTENEELSGIFGDQKYSQLKYDLQCADFNLKLKREDYDKLEAENKRLESCSIYRPLNIYAVWYGKENEAFVDEFFTKLEEAVKYIPVGMFNYAYIVRTKITEHGISIKHIATFDKNTRKWYSHKITKIEKEIPTPLSEFVGKEDQL